MSATSPQSKQPLDVSVILCTFNRCGSLANALASVAASKMPDSLSWELLVVDNNSKDRTRDVIENFVSQYPGHIRYLLEARPGKSFALNAGIVESRGRIIAFVDDDVVVQPDWLAHLARPLLAGECTGAGGRILPLWTGEPPAWMPVKKRYGLAPLAAFDLGVEPGSLDEPPFGTNMAFQRGVFEKYGGFRTDLGPRPGSEIRNEDTEFGRRLLIAGEKLKYEPAAIVYHTVPENRLRKSYFLNWWYGKGRADAREFHRNTFRLFCSFGAWTLRWMTAFAEPERFHRKIIVWEKAGAITEWGSRLFRRNKGKQTEQQRPAGSRA
jgi:glucosyl-dolichyl phosphate glucuronosyltransferase